MHLLGREYGGLAFANAVLRSADGMGWIGLHDVAGDQPIEQHPDRGQVLFDGGLGVGAAELFDVSGDVHRCDPGEVLQTPLRAPVGKGVDGLEVGPAGMRVADVDGEELPEAPAALGHGLEERGETKGFTD